jgi:hypothetical protein
MKEVRFTEEQIVAILREVDRGPVVDVARSILEYRSVRAERDARALDAMRRIAARDPRYGYRRVRIFLRCEGHLMAPAAGLSTVAFRRVAIAGAATATTGESPRPAAVGEHACGESPRGHPGAALASTSA